MMKFFLFLFSLLIFGTFSTEKKFPYQLNKVDKKYVLPDELREISGVSIIHSNLLVCVQDELGKAFFYDLEKKKVVREIQFAHAGDYEGIAPVNKDLWILRSDGVLFQIHSYASAKPKVDSIQTGIPNTNNEGLCYDSKNKQLLIGSKNKISSDKSVKHLRTIYAFDVVKKKRLPEPKFTLDLKQIRAQYYQQNAKTITPETEKEMKIKISGMFVHPKTQELYVLSAQDYFLFVLSQTGEATHIEKLDKNTFNKSEGIAIMPNGNLYISNEGQTESGNILLFLPNKN